MGFPTTVIVVDVGAPALATTNSSSLPPRNVLTMKFNALSVKTKLAGGGRGHVLDDVPHLVDHLPYLRSYPSRLQDQPAYSVFRRHFVSANEMVPEKIMVDESSRAPATHFRLAGPRERVFFQPGEVSAAIVTCGGLCPGLNTVVRELVCGLHMYGVTSVVGIEGGYKGFYARNTVALTPRSVDGIHKRGGTVLSSSRGGLDTAKIVNSIQDRGINQVYIIGCGGTQKGAAAIHDEVRRRGMKCAVVGIPRTVDNDIAVIDRSFGFDTAVEEARRAISAAHVEAENCENGIGVVKLMGRNSGFIAMHATLASGDVDCCLIPESPFFLDGKGGLLEFVEKRLRENGHMVIVVAEGAGQDLIARSMHSDDTIDASGSKLLLDVGLWLSLKIKEHFKKKRSSFPISLKYIDPTYMIRAVPSNASDNVYCTQLAHNALHGAMAGYTGFTVGPVNGQHAYIPLQRITEKQKKVVTTDQTWATVLCSTNQPCFQRQWRMAGTVQ